MYLLVATLVAGNALAFPELTMPIGGCGGHPPPCTRLATGDASILPSDWLELVTRNLGGEFTWFRVEVPLDLGRYDITVGGVHLDERSQSREESSASIAVFYVPAGQDLKVEVRTEERDPSAFALVIDGAWRANF